MAHTDSFDTRDPFRPPPLLSLFPLLALLWAAAARGEEPPAPAPSPSPAPADDRGYVQKKIDSLFEDEGPNGEAKRVHWGPLYPSVVSLSAGAGLGPMLQFWQPDVAGSGLDFQAGASYSVRQYQFYAVRLGRVPRIRGGKSSFSTSSDRFFPLGDIERLSGASNRIDLFVDYRFREYPREDFYGVGRDTALEDHTDFQLRDHVVELATGYHFSPRFALTARAGLIRTSLGPGRDSAVPDLPTRFDDLSAPGLGQPPDELVLTAGMLADLRDEPGNPHRGAVFIAGLSRFDDRHGHDFEFTRAAADARVYLPLGSHRHVLAARAMGSFDRPDAGARVPFYLQSSLGGSQVLRGYPAYRFREDRLVAFSAEYRFEVIPKLELAAFFDAGQMAPLGAGLRLSDPLTGWGVGVRLKSTRRVLFRFDVAHSREATRYLVKLGPSF
jgi:outer membrane protein assembly factor BamA